MKTYIASKSYARPFRTLLVLMVAAAILLQTGCGLFGDGDGEGSKTDISEMLPDQSGYDIVLDLDESGSLGENGILERNKAADIFVQMLTENCSVGAVFFSGKVNKVEGRDSLIKPDNRNKYLEMFGTGKKARLFKGGDGTRLDLGLKSSLKLLRGSDNPNKAIILFTDGMNEPKSISAQADRHTHSLAQTALTAGKNDEPIPIYVVYLDQKKGAKNKNIKKLENLFSTEEHKAFVIDSPGYHPEIWDKVPWSDTSVNKIISTDDPDELIEIFCKLLNKMRNLTSYTFKEIPDENNKAVIRVDVPEFKTSCIQLILTGREKCTATNMTHVKGKEKGYPINKSIASGEYLVYNINARNGSFAPGQWEIEVKSKSDISGSVTLFSDFHPSVDLLQNGSEIKTAKSFTDTEVQVQFLDSSGDVIKPGKGWKGEITVGEQNFGSMFVRDNAIISQKLPIQKEGEIPVHISLHYGSMLYSIDHVISVEDADPVILKEKVDCIYDSSQHLGSFIDIGRADEYAFDAKDGEELHINVLDDSNETAYVLTYREMANVNNIKLNEEPDGTRHIFLPDRNGLHNVTIQAVDSDGHFVSGKTAVNVKSADSVRNSRILLSALIILVLTGVLLVTLRNHSLSEERKYNVVVTVTEQKENKAIAPIPYMCDLDRIARKRIFLNKQTFFRSNRYQKIRYQNLPFILDAGKVITLRLSALRALKAHTPLFGFRVEPVAGGGDKNTVWHLRRCTLKPDRQYIIHYDNMEFQLSFSAAKQWNRIFTFFDD